MGERRRKRGGSCGSIEGESILSTREELIFSCLLVVNTFLWLLIFSLSPPTPLSSLSLPSTSIKSKSLLLLAHSLPFISLLLIVLSRESYRKSKKQEGRVLLNQVKTTSEKRHKGNCTANFENESEDLDDVAAGILVERETFKLSLPKMQEEDTWSLLPDLLLWMIRDKLDIFDNIQLDAVCRGWRSASTCFPKRLQSVGDGFPWIMQWSKGCKGTTALEFVDVVGRRRKFTIELPELYEASVIFSKQGWILLQRPNFSKSRTVRSSTSFFLINLFTKFKIKMADIVVDSQGDYHGSFSTNLDGYPNCVVLLDPDCRDQVTFRVAYPGGNEAWTQHSFLGQTIRLNGTLRMFIIRQDVYCLDKVANMIIYNTSSHTWKQVVDLEDRLILPFTMEHEGKIVKVVRDGTHVGAIMCSFFQYDDSWERLNIEDLKDTSWFLSHGGYSFSAKNKGLKAYLLCPKFDCTSINVVPQIDGHSVLLVDLTDGRREVPKLSHPLSASVSWVDIG